MCHKFQFGTPEKRFLILDTLINRRTFAFRRENRRPSKWTTEPTGPDRRDHFALQGVTCNSLCFKLLIAGMNHHSLEVARHASTYGGSPAIFLLKTPMGHLCSIPFSSTKARPRRRLPTFQVTAPIELPISLAPPHSRLNMMISQD